jgi:sirohydrochlorin ferrochelatase
MADFKCLVAAIGRLHAMVQKNQERLEASVDAHEKRMEAWQKLMTVCLGKMEACLGRKESAPVEMANIVSHLEGSNGVTCEAMIGATDSRSRDWRLAVGRCQHPKKWTQHDGGPQQKLAAALFLHHTTDTVIREQSRTMLYAEPLEDRLSRRDIGHDLNATVA